MKRFISAASAYLIITFPLAVVWHIVIFKSLYDSLGYFGTSEPNFLLGFIAILSQGLVLAALYPVYHRYDNPWTSTLCFSALVAVFLWACHVVAYAAKHDLTSIAGFIGIETLYMAVQFGLYAFALRWIFATAKE